MATRQRIVRALIATAMTMAATAAVIVSAQPASASTPAPSEIFSYLNRANLIGVAGGSTSDGANVITTTPSNSKNGQTNNPDQVWKLDYTFRNTSAQRLINGNNKCMGVAGGSTALGAHIVQWTCNGHLDQEWIVKQPSNGGGWNLYNANSQLCVGIDGNNPNAGAQLVQWTCDGGTDKLWIPDSVPWPPHFWFGCIHSGNTCDSSTDPINVVFYSPNGSALSTLKNAMNTYGWKPTTCYFNGVWFDPNSGILEQPGYQNVQSTDSSGPATCGSNVRDHARLWQDPSNHYVYIAASVEQLCGCISIHTVLSFNDGRDQLFSSLVNAFDEGAFTAKYVHQYGSGSINGVSFDGNVAVVEIG